MGRAHHRLFEDIASDVALLCGDHSDRTYNALKMLQQMMGPMRKVHRISGPVELGDPIELELMDLDLIAPTPAAMIRLFHCKRRPRPPPGVNAVNYDAALDKWYEWFNRLPSH